jgi:hypothetical protein
VRKSEELKRITLGGLVFISLLTIPAYLTGEPAESLVEHLPGVSEALIEQHEEAALFAFIALGITGAFALLTMIWFRRRSILPVGAVAAALLLTSVSVGLMARTANLGGEIRHTEIRAASNSAPSAAEAGSQKDKKHEDEERGEERNRSR